MMSIAPSGDRHAVMLLDTLFSAGIMRRFIFVVSIFFFLGCDCIIMLTFPAIPQRNKAPREQAIPLLMPQHHMVIPHYMGMSDKMENGSNGVALPHKKIKRHDSFSSGSSSQDIPLLMPQEAEGGESFKEELKINGFHTGNDFHDQRSRSSRIPFSFRRTRVEPLVPDLPMKGFVDDLDQNLELSSNLVQPGMKKSDKDWWETQERGDQVVSLEESGQVGPRVSCRCQVSYNPPMPTYLWMSIFSVSPSFYFFVCVCYIFWCNEPSVCVGVKLI